MAAELSPVMPRVTDTFDELLREHAARVYGFVSRMVGPEAAEDVCQDVWVSVWRAWPRFRGEAKLTTWLLAIAGRVCGKQRRRLRRSPPPDETAAEALPEPTGGPELRLVAGELAERVRAAIDALPPGQRETVHLRLLEELSYEEIAVVLQIPIGTVRSRLHHGTARLATALRPYLEGSDDAA